MPSGPTPSQARFVTATQQVLALAETHWAGHDMEATANYIAEAHDRIDGRAA